MNSMSPRELAGAVVASIAGQLVAILAIVPLEITGGFWFSVPSWVTALALAIYASVVIWIAWRVICLTYKAFTTKNWKHN